MRIPPIVATVPALFAKSSLVWPAVLNLLMQKKEGHKLLHASILEPSRLLAVLAITSGVRPQEKEATSGL